MDEFTRECLAIDVAKRLTSENVLERLSNPFIHGGRDRVGLVDGKPITMTLASFTRAGHNPILPTDSTEDPDTYYFTNCGSIQTA